jgi:hypothetical protein
MNFFYLANPFLPRRSRWRGRRWCYATFAGAAGSATSTEAGRRVPCVRSAAPLLLARLRSVRRHGEWRGTLGLETRRPARPSLLLPLLLLTSLLWDQRRRRRISLSPFSNPWSKLKDLLFNLFYKVISFNSLYFHPNECSQTLDPNNFRIWVLWN